MTNYSRRDTVKGLGALLSTAAAGCTAPTNNDMNEVDQALTGDCQELDIKSGEKQTLSDDSNDYKIENLAVNNNGDSAVINLNGRVKQIDESYNAQLGDHELEVDEIYQTGPNEGLIKMKYGLSCE